MSIDIVDRSCPTLTVLDLVVDVFIGKFVQAQEMSTFSRKNREHLSFCWTNKSSSFSQIEDINFPLIASHSGQ